jgi:putative salt-induced outer membrane protein YdiY
MSAISKWVTSTTWLTAVWLTGLSHAATVTLTSGDRLSGTISASTPEVVTLQHPLLGELSLPRSEIAAIDPDPAPASTEESVETVVAEQDAGLLGSGWLSDWTRRVEVGITGAAGNSENQKITAGFTAGFEDETTRWAHETAYYRNESDGSLTDNTFKSLLNRDWLQPGSPWFQFAGGRFDWDEFQDWDTRLTGNGGIGYEFIGTDRLRLLGRAGLGANQTFGDREELTLEGLLEVDAIWRISPAQTLAFTNTFHPNLEESGEYRNLTSIDWTLDLDEASGLGLKISLSNDYDSLAADASDKNDFRYAGALVWKL